GSEMSGAGAPDISDISGMHQSAVATEGGDPRRAQLRAQPRHRSDDRVEPDATVLGRDREDLWSHPVAGHGAAARGGGGLDAGVASDISLGSEMSGVGVAGISDFPVMRGSAGAAGNGAKAEGDQQADAGRDTAESGPQDAGGGELLVGRPDAGGELLVGR